MKTIEVPLIVDAFGLQPLDYALGNLKHVEAPEEINLPDDFDEPDMEADIRRFLPIPKIDGETEVSENIQVARVLLEKTKDYSLLSNSLFITNSLIYAIEMQLPEAIDYLQGRFKETTDYITSTYNYAIKEEHIQSSVDYEYGLIVLERFMDSKEVQELMFESSGPEKSFSYEFFDVPLIYYQTKQGYEFLEALKVYGQADPSIYKSVAIQILVENHWKHWKRINRYCILLPKFI